MRRPHNLASTKDSVEGTIYMIRGLSYRNAWFERYLLAEFIDGTKYILAQKFQRSFGSNIALIALGAIGFRYLGKEQNQYRSIIGRVENVGVGAQQQQPMPPQQQQQHQQPLRGM